jgi:hypothetical protein
MGGKDHTKSAGAGAEGRLMETAPMDTNERASLCYAMAYFALPSHVFQESERVLRELSTTPELTAKLLYQLTCKAREKEPHPGDANAFAVHSGVLNERYDYYLIEYPAFPPVDVGNVPTEQAVQRMHHVVLAPYFSAIVVGKETREVKYFVLGQSPDGQTTLRGVSLEMNTNLGRGCDPKAQAFLTLLRERLGAAHARKNGGAVPAKRWWEFWK